MARIAEIPLNKDFFEIDPLNLSIPIILNRSTPIDLRIKAANSSFKNKIISQDSLAALYQSVDFTSDQLNNPKKTVIDLSQNVELLMSYYFQLINIQIFPSERLQAILSFWEYSKKNNLENIAYSLTNNIIRSFEPSAENLIYGPEISEAYLYNQDFENAYNWISLYENNFSPDERSTFIRILLNLYTQEDVYGIIDIINQNTNNFANSEDKHNQELIYILMDVLDKKTEKELNEDFNFIFDQRVMPSLFIIEKLSDAIDNNLNNKFLIYTAISINNKNWKELHPNHLKLILKGFKEYQNGDLMKDIILEIFNSYKII